MGYVLETPPASEPITLAEAKLHCRVDGTDEDVLIASLITAARAHCENMTGSSFVTQTWRADFPGFPGARLPLRLPKGPVQSIISINYYDEQGSDTLLSSTYYNADITEQLAKVWLAPDMDWPSVEPQADAVRVTFDAGYGDADDVPQSIKQAILLLIGAWYDDRENPAVPTAVSALLAPHTIRALA
jgi:uncharacterized phiE125 gp8 family phage protein